MTQTFAEIVDQLSQTLPSQLIKNRTQGGTKLEYIEWTTAIDILDKYAPGWSQEIRSVQILGKLVVVVIRITINGVHRENTGIEEIETKGYGDAVSNAVAMAVKRCAAMFGVARFLYQDIDVAKILSDDEKRKDSEIETNKRNEQLRILKAISANRKEIAGVDTTFDTDKMNSEQLSNLVNDQNDALRQELIKRIKTDNPDRVNKMSTRDLLSLYGQQKAVNARGNK